MVITPSVVNAVISRFSDAVSLVWLCAECHQTCMSCSGPDANQCTQCEKGLVLDPNTLLCGVTGDTDCPPGTYLHDDQFTCMGCHRHCYSCEGPGNDECQTCAVPKYLHSEHILPVFNCIHRSGLGSKIYKNQQRWWFLKSAFIMQPYESAIWKQMRISPNYQLSITVLFLTLMSKVIWAWLVDFLYQCLHLMSSVHLENWLHNDDFPVDISQFQCHLNSCM